VQRVLIEAIEPDAAALVESSVVSMQPRHEGADVLVAPHPARKPLERVERALRVVVVGRVAAHVVIDAQCIGPVAFDRDGSKPVVLDQPARERGAVVVELVRAVRRLADHHDALVGDEVDEPIDVLLAMQRPRDRLDRLGHFADGLVHASTLK
jgi:hypothetical protein